MKTTPKPDQTRTIRELHSALHYVALVISEFRQLNASRCYLNWAIQRAVDTLEGLDEIGQTSDTLEHLTHDLLRMSGRIDYLVEEPHMVTEPTFPEG